MKRIKKYLTQCWIDCSQLWYRELTTNVRIPKVGPDPCDGCAYDIEWRVETRYIDLDRLDVLICGCEAHNTNQYDLFLVKTVIHGFIGLFEQIHVTYICMMLQFKMNEIIRNPESVKNSNPWIDIRWTFVNPNSKFQHLNCTVQYFSNHTHVLETLFAVPKCNSRIWKENSTISGTQ